jgi:hypothetical protein
VKSVLDKSVPNKKCPRHVQDIVPDIVPEIVPDIVPDILSNQIVLDKSISDIVISNINPSTKEEQSSSSSSSTMDYIKAESVLVTLVASESEYQKLAVQYQVTRMSKRNTVVEAVSFYECRLLIKVECEHPDTILITSPRSNTKLAEHVKKI